MDEFFMDYKEKMDNYTKDKEEMRIKRVRSLEKEGSLMWNRRKHRIFIGSLWTKEKILRWISASKATNVRRKLGFLY